MNEEAKQAQQECPRCQKPYEGVPAVSRVDNETRICSECGLEEAIEAMRNSKTPTRTVPTLALLETNTRTIPAYYLYPDGRDMLGIIPNGPEWGMLTITNEVDTNVRPYSLRKCQLEIYDESARQHWGESRKEFWIRNEGDSLVKALAHLNGQRLYFWIWRCQVSYTCTADKSEDTLLSEPQNDNLPDVL